VQAVVIPISDRHVEYALEVVSKLKKVGIRAEADLASGRMNAKIRNAQLQKIPYMLVVGEREMESKTVSLRLRTEEDLGAHSLTEVIEMIQKKVEEKALI
jgi:threonyl-tRNA synthetase